MQLSKIAHQQPAAQFSVFIARAAGLSTSYAVNTAADAWRPVRGQPTRPGHTFSSSESFSHKSQWFFFLEHVWRVTGGQQSVYLMKTENLDRTNTKRVGRISTPATDAAQLAFVNFQKRMLLLPLSRLRGMPVFNLSSPWLTCAAQMCAAPHPSRTPVDAPTHRGQQLSRQRALTFASSEIGSNQYSEEV